MFIVECSPIARGPLKERLSYFSKAEPKLGSVVEVPLRSKKIPALILKITPLSEEKLVIKKASFPLKKIENQKTNHFFLPETISAAEKTANYFLSTIGNVLEAFTPSSILGKLFTLKSPTKKGNKKPKENGIYTLQGGISDRLQDYKSLIREHFAKGESVLILVPTIAEANNFHKELSRGIERYSYIFESSQKPKDIITNWKQALLSKHPIMITTTPFALTIPRADLGCIILERENSRGFKTLHNPPLDARLFAEQLAKNYGARMIIADTALRIETIYREESGEISRRQTSKLRVPTNATSTIIDMKKKADGEKKEFAIIDPKIKPLIEEALFNNERIVIFAARRGVASICLCGDCGLLVKCLNCDTSVVLHQRGEDSYFLCHQCGERRSAQELCRGCGSWNLKSFGVTVDKVAEVVREMFKTANVFVGSKDNVRTATSAKTLFEKFYQSPRSILVGTEFIIPYLSKPFEHSIIASLDSLFSVPDYKMHEKIFHLTTTLRHLSTKTFTIQTRQHNHFVLECASRGDISGFYRQEIDYRKAFRFPPITTLIKITAEGKKEEISEIMKELLNVFNGLDATIFPAYIPKKLGRHSLHMLLRLPEGSWIDEKIVAILDNLPRNLSVEINPDTVI
jgi:primosomal protein N' (replication factor Y)